MSRTDHVRPDGAEPAPGAWPPGWTVWWTDSTGSTNTDLLDASAHLADRTVLAAGHQTAGRGRLDRRWEAPPGANLLVSVLFRTVPGDPGDLVRRIGLAVVTALGPDIGPGHELGLKWPNDVLLDGAKLAGILAQQSADGAVVVGLGLNVGWAPDGAALLGGGATPLEVLRRILVAHDRLPADVLALYRERLLTLGRQVQVERPHDVLTGRAIDVADDGRLVVLDDCGISHHLDAGDVVHLRPA